MKRVRKKEKEGVRMVQKEIANKMKKEDSKEDREREGEKAGDEE